MSTVEIGGNTYRARDLIKNRGGKWNAASKTWAIEASQWAVLAAMDCGNAVRGCRVVSGEDPCAPVSSSAEKPMIYRSSVPCPRCGTYCFGDCAE